MKRVIWVVAFLAILTLGSAVYRFDLLGAAHSQTRMAHPSAPVPVRVATATIVPTPVEFDTIGTVQTIASVAVKSRVDAVIDKVLIRDGQSVKAGDVMFHLDNRAAHAQVLLAEANLARDQAQLANAERDVARYKPLLSKNFVSRQQFDTSSTTAKALQATVEADQAQQVEVPLVRRAGRAGLSRLTRAGDQGAEVRAEQRRLVAGQHLGSTSIMLADSSGGIDAQSQRLRGSTREYGRHLSGHCRRHLPASLRL